MADPCKHTTKMGPPTMKLFYYLMERMVASMPSVSRTLACLVPAALEACMRSAFDRAKHHKCAMCGGR